MAIQIIQRQRQPNLGDYLASGLQGVSSGLESRRKMNEQSLANMKMMAELNKLNIENQNLQAPGQIPNNPYTNQPAGFVSAGKFYPYTIPKQEGLTPFQKAEAIGQVVSGENQVMVRLYQFLMNRGSILRVRLDMNKIQHKLNPL